MHKSKAPTKSYTCWSWCIIVTVFLAGLLGPSRVLGRVTQLESTSPQSVTSEGVKVSIIGNRINIETSLPVVVSIKALAELPRVKSELEKLREKVRQGWEGPIIIAPTP